MAKSLQILTRTVHPEKTPNWNAAKLLHSKIAKLRRS